MTQSRTFGRRAAPSRVSARTTTPGAAAQAVGEKQWTLKDLMAIEPDVTDEERGAPPGGRQATEADLARYFGGDWMSFRSVWRSMAAGSPWPAGFCWPALFGAPLWLMYRRSYALALGLNAVILCLFVASGLVGVAIAAGLQLFVALFGKAIVLKSAARRIERIKAIGGQPTEVQIDIARAGQTNVFAPIMLVPVSIAFYVALAAVGGIAATRAGDDPATPRRPYGENFQSSATMRGGV